MNLTKLANISEIVSSFAIVITLVFLALQMQQNTKAIEATSIQTASKAGNDFAFQSLQDPALVLSLSKRELSVEEQIKLGSWLTILSRTHESVWSQYQLGVIDREALNRYEAGFLWTLSFQRSRNWIKNVGPSIYSAEFIAYVNELLRTAPLITDAPEVYYTKIFERIDSTQ